ncbi:hypothetical protein EJ377_18150 [Chryseobacterium arthrosphaerae]|uniref:Uncharacterized protein n=1 Tax=Chryseobacterium arthrosphaerae TaxID=651561 RepID=A0A3S0N223_9FLAO|nr:hypothetical protein EJ377_18150 [Chryseobacterium arthrosphaerae]
MALYQNLIDFNTGNSKLYFQHQKLIYGNTAKKMKISGETDRTGEFFYKRRLQDSHRKRCRSGAQETIKIIQAVELIDKMKKNIPVQSFLPTSLSRKTDQSHFGFPFL